jgi:hypothetical protein
MSVVDSQNSTSNKFSIDIDGDFDQSVNFNFIVNIANVKVIPGDYEVELSSKLISRFSNKELNLKYWIALEKSSSYGV